MCIVFHHSGLPILTFIPTTRARTKAIYLHVTCGRCRFLLNLWLVIARLQKTVMANNDELPVKLGPSPVVAKCPERDRKQH